MQVVMNPGVSAAIQAAEAVLSRRRKIEEATSAARRSLPELQEQLATAQACLGQASAEAALGGTPAKVQSARRRITDIREQIESAELLIDGLGAKRRENDAELRTAHRAITRVWQGFVAEQIAALQPEYEAAGRAFGRVLQKAQAVTSALEVFESNLRDTIIYRLDLSAYHDELVSGKAEIFEGGRALPAWMSQPDASAAYSQLIEATKVVRALKGQIDQLPTDQQSSARAAVTTEDVSGNPVTITAEE